MSTLNLTGMDSTTGLFKISVSGDTLNVMPGSSSTALMKGNGAGSLTAATASTDYAPATSGSALLKGNGAGGFSNAASGTDYAPATSGTGLLKGNGSGGFSTATPGSDYQVALFVATATVTVTNTTTETSAIGATGVGSKTLAANYLSVGRAIRISGNGVYSAAAITPGTLTIKVKLGSTVIASTVLGSLVSGATTLGYDFCCDIVCQSAGASGTVVTGGSIDYATTSAGVRQFGDLANSGNTTTIDTTASQVLDVTVTWQTASASNIVKNLITIIESIW